MNKKKILIILIALVILILLIFVFFFLQKLASPELNKRAMEFVKENLYQDYRPESLNLKKVKNETGQLIYSDDWMLDDKEFHLSAIYNDEGDPDLHLTISMIGIFGDLNEIATKNFSKEFFMYPETDWRCKYGDFNSLCESNWLYGNDKKCVGVMNMPAINKFSLYFYEIPLSSNNYNKNWCGEIW